MFGLICKFYIGLIYYHINTLFIVFIPAPMKVNWFHALSFWSGCKKTLSECLRGDEVFGDSESAREASWCQRRGWDGGRWLAVATLKGRKTSMRYCIALHHKLLLTFWLALCGLQPLLPLLEILRNVPLYWKKCLLAVWIFRCIVLYIKQSQNIAIQVWPGM